MNTADSPTQVWALLLQLTSYQWDFGDFRKCRSPCWVIELYLPLASFPGRFETFNRPRCLLYTYLHSKVEPFILWAQPFRTVNLERSPSLFSQPTAPIATVRLLLFTVVWVWLRGLNTRGQEIHSLEPWKSCFRTVSCFILLPYATHTSKGYSCCKSISALRFEHGHFPWFESMISF